jgi:ABC-2 type transport system permease protein
MIRAELLKLSTAIAAKVAVIVGVFGLIATQVTLVTVLPALASGAIGRGAEELGGDLPAFDLANGPAQLAAVSPLGSPTGTGSIGLAVLAVLVLGVLAGTTDYRFGGIVPTALAQPKWGVILAAKVGAMAITGLLVGIIYAAVSAATLTVSLPVAGVELAVSPGDLVGVLARGAVVVMLLALLGLAIGVLARSQLVGVLAMLGVVLLEIIVGAVAQLVTGGVPVWARIMPLSLGQAAVSPGLAVDLPPLVALAALAALVAVVLAGAGVAMRSRDI